MNRQILQALRRFLANTSGNMGTIMAISAVPMFGIVGGAVDFARLHTARTQVRSGLDAAVLAGTRALMNGDTEAQALQAAQIYFDNNTAAAVELQNQSFTFKMNDAGTGILAEGNAAIDTSFLKVLSIPTLALFPDSGAKGSAEVGSTTGGDLEIALMLDVTGSMCDDGEGPCTSGSKITALKEAAKTLVDTVVWDDQSEYSSKVAIVPFSTRVRVEQDGQGNSMMKKLTDLGPTWTGWYKACTNGTGSGGSETGGNWSCSQYQTQQFTNWKIMPCVTDRFYDSGWHFDLTEAAPGSGAWFNAHDGSRMPKGPDSSANAATSAVGATVADPATFWNYEQNGHCFDVANANQILPLTNDKTALAAKINGLEAYGATAGVLGTAFSWYMLSPSWDSVWTGESAPQSYDLLTQTNEAGAPKLRKVAILMTDGVYNTYRGWKDQDTSFLSDNAIAMCNAMKAKGIEIYTVGFALDSLNTSEKATAEQTLKSCGSSVDHFYESLNVSDLQAAFKKIGNKVAATSVRLTQ